jgi:hypothetical protein
VRLFLILFGAGMQSSGFGYVLGELLSLPGRVEKLSRRDGRAGPRSLATNSVFPQVTVPGGRPPSIEQRVEGLEGDVRHLRTDCERRADALERKVEVEADRVQVSAAYGIDSVGARLEQSITVLVTGKVRFRWIALGLSLAGIAVSTWGALV